MWVLMELGDALSAGRNRQAFLHFIDRLAGEPDWEVVPASPALFARAVELFRERGDKEWSLTDCSSFVVMTERGITEALTNDHDFEQAGFRILLKA
jgi:predicted nucleic acid-binding protein